MKPYWTDARATHRRELDYFFKCHSRFLAGGVQAMAYPRTIEGFAAWLQAIGPIPSDLTRPCVGMIDRSKGYVPGNMQWQDFADLSRDIWKAPGAAARREARRNAAT